MTDSEPAGLAEVAQVGDRLATLRSLRGRLSTEIDDCKSLRDLASLSQRLMDVLEQIEAAEKASPAVKGTALDELARRRQLPAASSPRTARSK